MDWPFLSAELSSRHVLVEFAYPTTAAGFIEPCLPSPAEKPPSGASWIYEIKHDGEPRTGEGASLNEHMEHPAQSIGSDRPTSLRESADTWQREEL